MGCHRSCLCDQESTGTAGSLIVVCVDERKYWKMFPLRPAEARTGSQYHSVLKRCFPDGNGFKELGGRHSISDVFERPGYDI